MMGAGNAIRWTENTNLANNLNEVVAGIKQCQLSNGCIAPLPLLFVPHIRFLSFDEDVDAMAYEPNQTMTHENPDYVIF